LPYSVLIEFLCDKCHYHGHLPVVSGFIELEFHTDKVISIFFIFAKRQLVSLYN
jgi:hypothetical protein